MKLAIKPAKKEDFEKILILENVCFKEETFNKRQIKYLLTKAKSIVLIVEYHQTIIGSIIVLLRKHILSARIYSLNVHPKHRRLGIGKMLMKEVQKILKDMGFKKIILEVGINNKAAQALYNRLGFVVTKHLKNYYTSGDDGLRLVKKL